jgi:hypothetical protein
MKKVYILQHVENEGAGTMLDYLKRHKIPHALVGLNQAYAYGKNIYAFQFHIEVDRAILEDWFRNHAGKEKILKEYDAYSQQLHSIAERFYESFFRMHNPMEDRA